jgi:hypothetical protein
MERTQISLTSAQARRLRREAVERGVSIAQLIREAVDAYVAEPDLGRERRLQRARSAAGRFDSGRRDGSERHDEILAEDATGW